MFLWWHAGPPFNDRTQDSSPTTAKTIKGVVVLNRSRTAGLEGGAFTFSSRRTNVIPVCWLTGLAMSEISYWCRPIYVKLNRKYVKNNRKLTEENYCLFYRFIWMHVFILHLQVYCYINKTEDSVDMGCIAVCIASLNAITCIYSITDSPISNSKREFIMYHKSNCSL